MPRKQDSSTREPQPVRLGLIKSVPVKWDVEFNWQQYSALATGAAIRGAQLIIAPECFLDGYVASDEKGFTRARFDRISQPLKGGGFVPLACDLARELGVHLVFCFTQKAEKGSYNAAALIDDRGRIIGVYHKTHLLDHDRRYLPGRALKVWETALGRIGMMICADRRWPETARTLRLRGAQLIVSPSYGMCHYDNEWWMRTRSYENEAFIAFAHPEVALITGPRGEVAAKLQSNLPDVLLHEVDLASAPEIMLPARRADIYERRK